MDPQESTATVATPQLRAAERTLPSTTLYTSPEEVDAAGIGHHWQRLMVGSVNPRAMFQSPQWWEHVRAVEEAPSMGLMAVRDAAGELSGVVPFHELDVKLDYHVKTSSIGTTRLRGVEVLGGEPMLSPDPRLYDALFVGLDANYPRVDCFSLEMLPTDGFCWRYLNESPLVRKRFLLYVPDGISCSRLASLPGSFEKYLAKFKSKNRFNLKKKVRLLREHGGGTLRLVRYESAGEVDAFLQAGSPVAAKSWQQAAAGERIACNDRWRRKLADLADHGLFRAYVLVCGSTACAFVLGYQYDGVYHYVQPGYDPDYADFAPGIVALYLLIEDLIVHRPAALLSFGYGDSDYKRMFGNASSLDASVLLLRKTVRNRLRRASHQAFRAAVLRVKSIVRKDQG